MNSALDQLLQDCIDYAGLFPPADLTLGEAIDIFGAGQKSKHRNWLKHFILPGSRILEFDSLRADIGIESPWTLSLLVGGGDTLHDWQTSIEDFLAAMKVRCKDADPVQTLEIALPRTIAADTASFKQAIDTIELQLKATALFNCDLFFETTSDAHRRSLAGVLTEPERKKRKLGLKLRTGGITPELFPSADQLANFILLCHDRDLRWKATAGLHHPFPIDCQRTGATMHGFLNILVAVVLLEGNMIPNENIKELLIDRNSTHFAFCDEGLKWKDKSVNLEQIRLGRDRFVSFGSCSFAEPLEDLSALGLLTF